jgi:alginate O-acetyltransferase complex protein AlgI
MLFNTLSFPIFLLAALALFYIVKSKYRPAVLLLASIYFYFSLNPNYPIIIIFVILFNYFIALFINDESRANIKKFYFISGVTANVLFLALFKYMNFFTDSFRSILGVFSIHFDFFIYQILLPIGVSFYTFQNISYLIEVYRGKFPAERNFWIFSLYGLYFPKFISGPIERPSNLIPQLKNYSSFNLDNLKYGSKRILLGFFKKIVIADRLALFVNSVYGNPSSSGLILIIAAIFFVFQLYTDFSGYTDIAVGSSRLFDIKLTENFNRPLLAKNPSDFWRRWHISLSSWFQDYVFTPLYLFFQRAKILKNKSVEYRHTTAFIISILITEILLGLWHGANWTFVVFGFYFGILISSYYLLRKRWDIFPIYLQIVLTFVLLVIGMIFFRAESLSQIYAIFTHIFVWTKLNLAPSTLGFDIVDLFLSFLLIAALIFLETIQEKRGLIKYYDKLPIWAKIIIYVLLILAILILGVFRGETFIYRKF